MIDNDVREVREIYCTIHFKDGDPHVFRCYSYDFCIKHIKEIVEDLSTIDHISIKEDIYTLD